MPLPIFNLSCVAPIKAKPQKCAWCKCNKCVLKGIYRLYDDV